MTTHRLFARAGAFALVGLMLLACRATQGSTGASGFAPLSAEIDPALPALPDTPEIVDIVYAAARVTMTPFSNPVYLGSSGVLGDGSRGMSVLSGVNQRLAAEFDLGRATAPASGRVFFSHVLVKPDTAWIWGSASWTPPTATEPGTLSTGGGQGSSVKVSFYCHTLVRANGAWRVARTATVSTGTVRRPDQPAIRCSGR